MWKRGIVRKLLSYSKSHIYEIHALLVATFVVVLMSLIKESIKRKIVQLVNRKLETRPELASKSNLMIKRGNMLLILLAMFLSFDVFAVVALVSPIIEFSFPMAVMSGVFALCEYSFWEQITFGKNDIDIQREERLWKETKE